MWCCFRRHSGLSCWRCSWMSLEIKYVECWAFLQRWTKTKSCRCYLSYQLPVILPMMRYCWPTAHLGKSWESCTKQLYWIPLADPTRLLKGSCSSSPWALTWRIPRGSILPTLLFNIYAKPPGNMMKWYRQQCQTVCWRHMDLCAFFPSCRQHSPKPLSVESKGGPSWQRQKSEEIARRLARSGKRYKLWANNIYDSKTDRCGQSNRGNHHKGLSLSLSSQHNSTFKQWPCHAHVCFSHLGCATMTLP